MTRLPRTRVLFALLGMVLLVGSCVGDGPTDLGDNALVGVQLQPALIPSPADGSALPIGRIRTVVSSHPGGGLLREGSFDVSPAATSWTIEVLAPASQQPTDVVLYVYLIHVASDGTESVQFSGRTAPFSITAGTALTNVDVDIVRGPISNLGVTSVSVTSYPDTLVVGSSAPLSATATTSASTPPEIFWTSLDPEFLTLVDSVATGVSVGTASVVASAGAHVDTVDVVIIPPPVDSVRVLPDSADVLAGGTRAYTVELRDANGTVLTGRSVFWETLNASVATVTQSGVVNAVEPGTTRVRASSEGSFDEAVVRVVAVPVRSVLVSPDSAVVQAGNTTTYTAQTRDSIGGVLTGRAVAWTTGNAAVATVDPTTGVVTAVAAGTTTVRATSEGVFDEASVRVTAAPTGGPTIRWTLSSNGNWSNPSAWDLGRVPQAGDTVRIEQGDGYLVTLDVDATIARLVIGGSSEVVFLSTGDHTLTITGSGPGDELDILPLGALEIGNATVRVADVRNDGVIYGFDPLSTLEAATIVNNGEIAAVSDAVLTIGHPTAMTFRTSGTLTLEPGGMIVLGPNTVMTYAGGAIEGAEGSLVFGSGSTMTLEQDLSVDGPVIVLNGASILRDDGEGLTIGPSSALELASVLGSAEVEPALFVDGVLGSVGPSSRVGDLTIRTSGSVYVDGGTGGGLVTGAVDNSGTILLAGASATSFGPGDANVSITNRQFAGIQLTAGGNRILNGQLINEGEISVTGPGILRRVNAQGAHVTASHVNVNTGSITLALGGSFEVVLGGGSPTPSFTNSGSISVGASSTLSVTNVTSPAGQIITNPLSSLYGLGTVDVRTGVPTGVNNGTIGAGPGIGTLTWLGSIPMGPNGVIQVELNGTTPGTGHDQINVSATVALDGTLQITSPTFVPSNGDRFAVMTFAERVGNFDTVVFPNVPGMTFDTLWAQAGTVDTLFVVASGQGPTPTTWTGAVNTDWSNPGNWSPAQVPRSFDGVTIPSGPANQPTLTASAAAGSVTIAGDGARLTVGGQTLTVGGLVVHTLGLLVMTNPADLVIVGSSGAFFAGGDETGLLTAGELRIAGSFNQHSQSHPASFRASGTHRTVLTGSSLQTVVFCCQPGFPSGFQDLDISSSVGMNTQNGGYGVYVSGTLTSLVGTGPAPRIYMLGTPVTAARFQVDRLIVDRGTLTLDEGGVAQAQQFDNVTFENYLPTQTQLAVVVPGGTFAPRTLVFNNLRFQPLTTGNTGRYLNVTAVGGFLTLNLPGAASVVGNGPAFTTTAGNVTVNWQ